VWSISISVSVCLSGHSHILQTSCPDLLPVIVARKTMHYVMYFRFHGWRHFFHMIEHYVVYGEAYDRKMSVAGGNVKGRNLSAWAPPIVSADYRPSAITLAWTQRVCCRGEQCVEHRGRGLLSSITFLNYLHMALNISHKSLHMQIHDKLYMILIR